MKPSKPYQAFPGEIKGPKGFDPMGENSRFPDLAGSVEGHFCGYCGAEIIDTCEACTADRPTDSDLLNLAKTLEKLDNDQLAHVAGQCFSLIKSRG